MLGGDALFIEGVEAVDFVFFAADFQGGFAVETIYGHDGLPLGMNSGASGHRADCTVWPFSQASRAIKPADLRG
jgi:hypothetical protein